MANLTGIVLVTFILVLFGMFGLMLFIILPDLIWQARMAWRRWVKLFRGFGGDE